MTCYLVRHGEARPGPDDAARPLTPEGREAVEGMARRLAALGVEVAEIRHSGLVRARETAEILARRLRPPGGAVPVEGLAPGDDPRVARAALEGPPAPLMLVGHLPHLGRLAAALVLGSATREVVRFQPGSAVCLVRAGDGWAVEWALPPEPAGAR